MTTSTFRPRPRPAPAIFTVLLAAGFTLATAVSAAIPPAESLLPQDTLLLITVPDFAKLRETTRQMPQWLFWNDPAMKPFHDRFMAKWNEKFIAPLEQDLGVKFDDYTGLPQGQLTFAITQNGWTGGADATPGLLFLLDAKGGSDLLKTNLAALRKKWTDAGRPMRSETIRGISFSVVPLSSNDIPATLAGVLPKRQPVQELGKEDKPPAAAEIVFGQFESLLIVGSSIKVVEPVVNRLTGGAAPGLGDNALFAADRLAQFRGSPLYYGWLNAKTLFDVLAHIPPPEPNPDAPSPVPPIPWDKILSTSGLTGLKSASFSYRESHDGAQVDFYLSVPEAARQGLFKIIAAVPKDANPPVFVPADAVKYWRWRLDGPKSWATLQKMATDVWPSAFEGLNSLINIANATAQQKDPGFDVRQYLFGNLGDDWISYSKAPAGNTLADLNSAPSLFLFAAVNPDQAVLAIKNVASLASSQGNAVAPRQFLGRTIYTIALPARGAAARSLYCTTSDGYVALTTDVSMIEAFLRSADSKVKPLRETPGFASAAQHVGGAGNGLFAYENQRDNLRVFFTVLKNSSSADGAGAFGALPFAAPGKIFGDWMDFTLLPDYDKVSKYFYFSVTGGNVNADDLSFKVFAPRPPQLN
ncbi:MAG: hypothetical protein WAO02_05765 [Verrucomicrobiia bacterium]